MIILHIASIKDSPTNGVCVLVPKLIETQSKLATTGLLNFNEYPLDGETKCFTYSKPFLLAQLEKPFNKPDLVVFHQVYNTEYIKIAKALRKQNIPYVILPHGSLTMEAQRSKRLKKFFGNIIFNPFIKNASAIQFMTEKEMNSSKTSALKFVGRSGWTIPDKSKHSFSDKKIKFVYIGRLEYHIKGLDIMLDAFKLLMNSSYKDTCELCIYGPDYQGRYAHVEQMISERSLNELVKLNPPVFDKEKEDVLLESDVFIQTSRSEALTLGILEALSYGLPCLVTPGTTWGDSITKYNAGWVADPTPQSVFENIARAIDERKTFNEKSINAIKLVGENFSWEKSSRDIVEHYRNIVDDKGN